jgi:hypothetical protein
MAIIATIQYDHITLKDEHGNKYNAPINSRADLEFWREQLIKLLPEDEQARHMEIGRTLQGELGIE